jgi:hypothetical protein
MDPGCVRGVVLASLFACAEALAQEPAASVHLLVQSSPLAGFRYHAASDVWQELRVGDRLELAREPDNPHDANAVSVSWRGRKLGYLPRRENAAVAWGLDRGLALAARLSRVAPRGRRIEVEVYVE